MQVSLNLQKLAEANFASPVPVISGRPVDVIVRGKGFNNSGNISAQIKLGGLTPSSVSVINDTALSLHFSSIPAGTYPVQITNGLGLITNGATLVSIAPRAGVASVHDTSNLGQPKTMLYDSLHGDVYASYAASPISPTGLSTVIRFRPNGSGWQRTSLSIPGLIDIALSPDSTRLAAADTTNKINIIDLASFAVTESYQSSTPISYSGINNLEGALAFTNDGKLWLSGYNYFDLTSHSFGKTTFPCSSWCSVQGNLLVSRDGSRLIASSSGSVSPSGPMTYLDASDGLVHDNPAGLTFFYRNSSLSDSGKRFLFDGYSVYDQNFGKVGETARGVSLTRGAQLSPDGNRAYFANQSFTTPSTWSISVRDTSGPAGTQLSLPTVGSIDVPIKPSCEFSTGSAAANDTSNCFSTKMRIAPDGNSVIFLGDKYLVVVPIPQSMSGLSSLPASINLKKATSGGLY
jgi:hypothetical protein